MRENNKKFISILLLFILTLSVTALPAYAFAAEEERITEVDQLDGKKIGVQTAVLYEEMLFDRLPKATYQYYTMPNDMIIALQSNKVSAYLIEEVSFYVQKANHPMLTKLEEPAGIAEYAIVIGNNEKQGKLLLDLNEFIAEMKESGELKDMYDYWIVNYDPDESKTDLSGLTGERGTISVAIEGGYEPFSYVSNGEPSGYDVDFVCRFCRAYGYKPEFFQVPFESIAPGVEAGKYDLGMNIVLSDERSESIAMSDPYITCPINIIVMGDDESNMSFFAKMQRSFHKTFIKENRWKLFAEGTGITVLITLSSILLGTMLGFIMYMMCRHGNRLANAVTDFFLWLIHGLPTVVLLMILYYIVFGSTKLGGTWVSIVGFSLMFACSMYDMLKVGCNAIGRGQTEASRALGYTDSQSFFKIILPQAAGHFLPIYRNEIVTLIKETSVVGYIAVLDLTKISDLVRSRTYEAFFPLIATAIVYFIISGLMTAVVGKVETNIDPKRRSDDKVLKGIKISE